MAKTTKYKWVPLTRVFDGKDTKLDAAVARVCVLFEDLRLELDEAGAPEVTSFRRYYFVRRSIGTLREFIEALLHLNGLSGFQPVVKQLKRAHRGEWNSAIARLRTHQERIYRERNAYGGHFSYGAAMNAVQNLEHGTAHALEIHWTASDGTAGPRFHFVSELAGLALLSGKPDETSVHDYAHDLFTVAFDGYRHATVCGHILAANYLAPRFGFKVNR